MQLVKLLNQKIQHHLKKSVVESTNDVTVLKESLIKFFKSLSSYSLLNANEAMLQAVTELLLPKQQDSGVILLIDNTKSRGDGRFGFVNLIFGGLNYSIIELKYVNILGLVKAKKKMIGIYPQVRAI